MTSRALIWACALAVVLPAVSACASFGRKSDFELKATADEALRRREYNRVIALDTELIRRNPADYTATLQRAIALDRLGRSADALSDYSRAIELEPQAALPRLYRANISLRLGQADAARGDLQALQGIQLGPSERIAAFTLHGTLEQALGRHAQALRLYAQAINLGRSEHDQHGAKHYRDALHNAAECHYRLGDFQSAIARLNEALRAKQRAGIAVTEDDHYTLGVLYYFDGQFDQARGHFKQVSPARRDHAAQHLNDPSFFEAL